MAFRPTERAVRRQAKPIVGAKRTNGPPDHTVARMGASRSLGPPRGERRGAGRAARCSWEIKKTGGPCYRTARQFAAGRHEHHPGGGNSPTTLRSGPAALAADLCLRGGAGFQRSGFLIDAHGERTLRRNPNAAGGFESPPLRFGAPGGGGGRRNSRPHATLAAAAGARKKSDGGAGFLLTVFDRRAESAGPVGAEARRAARRVQAADVTGRACRRRDRRLAEGVR